MRTLLLYGVLAVSVLTLQAQVPIKQEYNSPRMGDILCKVQIPYVDLGESGRSCVWYLKDLSDGSPSVWQAISTKGDTIAIYEKGRINHYISRNDTLFDKGWQERRAYSLYEQMKPVLRYPFNYRDSIGGSFCGSGQEENHSYTVSGLCYSKIDAKGIITDTQDTLQHVNRLLHHSEYILEYSGLSSIHLVEDNYKWYCAGYRYPVMESYITKVIKNSVSTTIDSISYLFLPALQCELNEDPDNMKLLEELAELEKMENADMMSNLKAGLSADGMSVRITYTLIKEGDIEFSASDMVGFILGHTRIADQEEGDYELVIPLSRRPIGNTLMLNIKAGEKTLCIKVFK